MYYLRNFKSYLFVVAVIKMEMLRKTFFILLQESQLLSIYCCPAKIGVEKFPAAIKMPINP